MPYAELSASKKNMFSYWGNHELNGAVIDGSSAASYSNDYNTEGYFSVLYMITMQNIIFRLLIVVMLLRVFILIIGGVIFIL